MIRCRHLCFCGSYAFCSVIGINFPDASGHLNEEYKNRCFLFSAIFFHVFLSVCRETNFYSSHFKHHLKLLTELYIGNSDSSSHRNTTKYTCLIYSPGSPWLASWLLGHHRVVRDGLDSTSVCHARVLIVRVCLPPPSFIIHCCYLLQKRAKIQPKFACMYVISQYFPRNESKSFPVTCNVTLVCAEKCVFTLGD